jgi:hypothetical protein
VTQIIETIQAITTENAAARGAIIGTIVGFFVVGGITVAIALNAGTSVVSAAGVGAFAAFWGGPGFGGMLGATLAACRNEDLERERKLAQPKA